MSAKSNQTNRPLDPYEKFTRARIIIWSLFIGVFMPILINLLIRVGNWVYAQTGLNISASSLGNVEWWLFYGSFLGGLFTLCTVFLTLKQNAKQIAESRDLQIHTLISQFNEQTLTQTKELVSNAINALDTDLLSALRQKVGSKSADFPLILSESFSLYARQKEAYKKLYLLTDLNHDRTPCIGCDSCKTKSFAECVMAAEKFKNCLEKSAAEFTSMVDNFMRSADMADFNLGKIEERALHQKIVDNCTSMMNRLEPLLKGSEDSNENWPAKIEYQKCVADRDSHLNVINEIEKTIIPAEAIGELSAKVTDSITKIEGVLATQLLFAAQNYLLCKAELLYNRTKRVGKFGGEDAGCKKYQDYFEQLSKVSPQEGSEIDYANSSGTSMPS